MNIKVELTNSSIEKLGISKDFKDCICEYIWNGFDAQATKIDICTNLNHLGNIESIDIKDNGNGITFCDLNYSFKNVLDSSKSNKDRKGNIHGSKGKGRFSFIPFSDLAEWDTTYKDKDGTRKTYKITIAKKTANECFISKLEDTTKDSGTKVSIKNIYNSKIISPDDIKFKKYLKEQFAWFLYLNKNKEYEIYINGTKLNYMTLIDEDVSENLIKEIDGYTFDIRFIKWNNTIKEKYYFYFRNSEATQVYKKTTSFNNKGLGFPHSIYIDSKYFDNFYEKKSKENIDTQNELLEQPNQRDKIFKELEKYLIGILKNKAREYIKIKAPKEIIELERQGAFPRFEENNKYDQIRKDDLKEVLKEIYIIQPKVFIGELEQKKTIVGFLNLLLETNEREGILNIMDSINSLTQDERKELSDVLKKTTLSKILKTITMLESRLKVIESLKILVYDNTKFTNERDHIQKIVEDNYWIFGEQYSLASADKQFEVVLKNYLYTMDDNKEPSIEDFSIDNPEKMRRPDIFMCRSRNVYYENVTEEEENIIVELKAPYVVLNKKILRQIEDYMDLISTESKFNSDLRKWKFIAVSTKVDDYVRTQYDLLKDKGKRFFIGGGNRFELYAMTWDDVFKNFEINHKYILEKLDLNKTLLREEVENMSDKEFRELADELTIRARELATKIN